MIVVRNQNHGAIPIFGFRMLSGCCQNLGIVVTMLWVKTKIRIIPNGPWYNKFSSYFYKSTFYWLNWIVNFERNIYMPENKRLIEELRSINPDIWLQITTSVLWLPLYDSRSLAFNLLYFQKMPSPNCGHHVCMLW